LLGVPSDTDNFALVARVCNLTLFHDMFLSPPNSATPAFPPSLFCNLFQLATVSTVKYCRQGDDGDRVA